MRHHFVPDGAPVRPVVVAFPGCRVPAPAWGGAGGAAGPARAVPGGVARALGRGGRLLGRQALEALFDVLNALARLALVGGVLFAGLACSYQQWADAGLGALATIVGVMVLGVLPHPHPLYGLDD